MTTEETTAMPTPAELGEMLKDTISKAQPGTTVQVTPHAIPPHIAGNLLEFLRRVKSEGMEAIAWVEAYGFVQQHAPQQAGVPFGGLPKKA